MWDLEVIGIKDERFTHSKQVAVSQVKHDMRKMSEGYEVQLPFVSENHPSVNFRTACAQMNSLIKKFKGDVELFDKYEKVISDYIERGFIEIADLENKTGCSCRITL